MRLLLRWSDKVATLLAGAGALVAMAMSFFVVLSSVMRYVIGAPFAFTEELVGLLFTALVFVGIPVCTFRRSHISVTIVPDLFSGRARRMIDRLAYVLLLVFMLWFGKLTWDYLQTTLSLNARSAGSRLILWPWVALMPLSCLLSALAALLRIVVPDRHHAGESTQIGGG